VRTAFTDDLLWLPYVVAIYVEVTGDQSVLNHEVGFITGRELNPGEESYYDLPGLSNERASVYEHCLRAIRRGLKFGAHGLPLMGCGDWNDGMNLVGIEGRGESVWLAFFLHDVLGRFRAIAIARGDKATTSLCALHMTRLSDAISVHAWDGEWFLRAFFDNGEPLGSHRNSECQIDILPQAWAVISKAVDTARASRAMAALNQRLVRHDVGLIQLFDPPFDHSDMNPGYIKGYVPGVRENGGQYTHAAIWAIWAYAELGQNQLAWDLFELINPLSRLRNQAAYERYKVEPYVVAADVYAAPQHAGRGGWTWYTGSASWMYRLLIEVFMGVRREGERLRLAPCLNPAWPSCELSYQYKSARYSLRYTNAGSGLGVKELTVDGRRVEGDAFALVDDGQEHEVTVVTH
jgi:cellobiose phosphorylase